MYSSTWIVISRSSSSSSSSLLFRFFSSCSFLEITPTGLPVIFTVPSGFFPFLPHDTESTTICPCSLSNSFWIFSILRRRSLISSFISAYSIKMLLSTGIRCNVILLCQIFRNAYALVSRSLKSLQRLCIMPALQLFIMLLSIPPLLFSASFLLQIITFYPSNNFLSLVPKNLLIKYC